MQNAKSGIPLHYLYTDMCWVICSLWKCKLYCSCNSDW